mgnify:CR=1 FL=1
MIHTGVLLSSVLFSVICKAEEPFIPVPKDHPRLILLSGKEQAVRDKISSDPVVAGADSTILSFCHHVMPLPPVERIKIGKRLLHVSREALKRIFYLSYAWRVHGDYICADRAIEEMMAVCRFSDWNPSHFLDVGEMTMAVAIGYDWLYPRMTSLQRDSVVAAIRNLAFSPSRNEKRAWFYKAVNNWNQVCNSGLVYGALALWESCPEEAENIVRKCLETNPLSLASYSPEGGYPEGYDYWGYGSSFQIMLLAALDSSFGSDIDLMKKNSEGFYRSGEFLQMMRTPTGKCYSFYDSPRSAHSHYMQAYMALCSGDLSLLQPEVEVLLSTKYRRIAEDRLFPMFPILAAKIAVPMNAIPKPTARQYVCGGTTPVYLYRSGWESSEDTYLAVKGGISLSSHAHADQGSFYFEDDGVVWATDLGSQNYESLESKKIGIWTMTQDSDRWNVFRIGPFSHNILTVNGHKPKINHAATFAATGTPDHPGAELNLSAIYSEDLDSCYRKVYLRGNELVVEDWIEARDTACRVRWAICSETDAGIEGKAVRLSKGGQTRYLRATILRPSMRRLWGRFTSCVWETSYPEGLSAPDVPAPEEIPLWSWPHSPIHSWDYPNPGTSLSGFILDLKPREKVVLRVVLSTK